MYPGYCLSLHCTSKPSNSNLSFNYRCTSFHFLPFMFVCSWLLVNVTFFQCQDIGINPIQKKRKLEIQIPSCIALFVNLPVNVTYSTFNCQDIASKITTNPRENLTFDAETTENLKKNCFPITISIATINISTMSYEFPLLSTVSEVVVELSTVYRLAILGLTVKLLSVSCWPLDKRNCRRIGGSIHLIDRERTCQIYKASS